MKERHFKFKVILSCFVVFISGYLCGLLNIFDINPNLTFLSDIIAFETVMVAILIPLSIEIISRISERYNSEVLIYVFQKHLGYKISFRLLLSHLVVLIILKFFITKEYTNSLVWKIIAWIMLFIFIIIAIVVGLVINRIIKFVSDPKYVLDQLYQNVKKNLE